MEDARNGSLLSNLFVENGAIASGEKEAVGSVRALRKSHNRVQW